MDVIEEKTCSERDVTQEVRWLCCEAVDMNRMAVLVFGVMLLITALGYDRPADAFFAGGFWFLMAICWRDLRRARTIRRDLVGDP